MVVGVAALVLAAAPARAACGDGVVNGGEACDASASNGDVACPGSCIPNGQPNACTCLRPSTDVRDYAIVADGLVKVGSNAIVSGGHVAARAGGGSLRVAKGAALPENLDAVGDRVKLSNGAKVGRVFANTLAKHKGALVFGGGPFGFTPPLLLTMLSSPPVFSAGNTAITVPDGGTRILEPGSYGDVTVGTGGRLLLQGLNAGSGAGRYRFQSVKLGTSARLEADDPAIIVVVNRVTAGVGAYLGPRDGSPLLPGDVQLEVGGSAVKVNRSATALAYVRAPNGKVTISRGALLAGRLIGSKVSLSKGGSVVRAGGCGNGVLDAGEQCDASAAAGDGACPGACIPGDLGDQSRIDLGEPGQCTCRCTSNADCDDDDVCDGDETCSGGRCMRGTPLSCDDGNACTVDCDPQDGCVNEPLPDGQTCSDGNACTVGDECQNGDCVADGPRTCDDGNSCTTDTCSPSSGCKHTPLADQMACSDGNACTTTDRCVRGACVGGANANCNDNNPCTDDACDREEGCDNEAVPNGVECSDNNPCTQGDSCQAGTCTVTGPTNCSDQNPCTTDACNPTAGCTHAPLGNNTPCGDGNACTQGDSCQSGVCVPGAAVNCGDNNPCTDDTCNVVTGCAHAQLPNGTACSDANPCTVGDVCQAGACVSTGPASCNDNNPCTVDACSPTTGCANVPLGNGTACSDGNACTQNDTCQSGLCQPGTGLSCADTNPCTTDTCHPVTGCAHAALPNGASCSDGNACTAGESCQSGQCLGGNPPNCADTDPCTADLCDSIAGCQHPALPVGTPCGGGKTCRAGGACS